MLPTCQLGIYDQGTLNQLTKKTRVLMKIAEFNNKRAILFVAFFITLLPCAFRASIIQTVLFGVPNGLFFALFGYCGYNCLLHLGFYLHIICFYLSIKLKTINKSIKHKKKPVKRII